MLAVCIPALASPQATSAPSTIQSSAQLDAFLASSRADKSALSLLPAGARHRFLETLGWGERGLGTFSTGDLSQYLTAAQIRQVLALFGLQDYALHGRVASLSAEQRGAAPTRLEHNFDELYFANEGAARGEHPPASTPSLYDELLAPYQQPGVLARLDDSDIGLLYRAAILAASATRELRYFDDLRLDLAELRQRGLATTARVTAVHDQLVGARLFDAANALARDYATAAIAPLPSLQAPAALNGDAPTALVMDPDARAMRRIPIDLQAPLRIVVVAGCHFSEDAARAIREQPDLDKLFHEHAIWLAPDTESLPAALQWNRQFPRQVMHVAWRNSEWSVLESWNIPTFYVFRDGRLVETWSGWPPDTGMQSLRDHLEKAGAIRAPSA